MHSLETGHSFSGSSIHGSTFISTTTWTPLVWKSSLWLESARRTLNKFSAQLVGSGSPLKRNHLKREANAPLESIVAERVNVTKDQEGLWTGQEDDQNRHVRELEVSSTRKMMITRSTLCNRALFPSDRRWVSGFKTQMDPGRGSSSTSPAR